MYNENLSFSFSFDSVEFISSIMVCLTKLLDMIDEIKQVLVWSVVWKEEFLVWFCYIFMIILICLQKYVYIGSQHT